MMDGTLKHFSKKLKIVMALVVVVFIGLVGKNMLGSNLKGEEVKPFLEVRTKTTELASDTLVNTESVIFTLKSSENRLIKIPDNEGYKIAAFKDEKETISDLPKDFSEEALLKKIQKSPEKIKIGNTLFHQKDDQEGVTYLTLLANETIDIIAHHTIQEEKTPLEVVEVASGNKQILFTFTGINEVKAEVEEVDTNKEKKIEETNEGQSAFRGAGDSPLINFVNTTVGSNDIIDGTANFDNDNQPGHDSSANNKIVRSFDTITYNVSFTTQAANSSVHLSKIKYKLKCTYPNGHGTINGQEIDLVRFTDGPYDPSDPSTAIYDYAGEIPNANGSASVSIGLNVFGAPNGYQIKPKFHLILISGQDQNGNTIPLNVEKDMTIDSFVTVSSKPSVTARIGTDNNLRANYNALTGETNPRALTQLFSVSLVLTPLNDGSIRGNRPGLEYTGDFRGAAYPLGEVTGTVDKNVEYRSDNNPSLNHVLTPLEQEPPKVISYGFITKNEITTEKFTKTPEFSSTTIKSQSADYLSPDAVRSKETNSRLENCAAKDSGEFTVKNISDSQLRFSFKNSVLVDNANRYIDDKTVTPRDDIYFASGFGVMKIPTEYIKNQAATLRDTFTLTSIQYNDNGRMVTQNVNSKVDILSNDVSGGQLMVLNPWRGGNGEHIGSGKQPDSYSQGWDPRIPYGDEKITVGNDLTASTRITANTFDSKYVETLTVWNGATAELSKAPRAISEGGSTPQFEVEKVQYGVLKDGGKFSGLDTNYEGKLSKFTWYDTLAQAKKNGTVTGYYSKLLKSQIEYKSVIDTNFTFTLMSGTTGAKDKYGNPNVIYTIGKFTDDNGKTVSYPTTSMGSFKPTVYDNNGSVVTYQEPRNTYGDTLFVTPMITRIKAASYGSVGSANAQSYSNLPYRWVNKLDIKAGDKDDYKIRVTSTLSKGQHYVGGSSTNRGNLIGSIHIDEPIEIKTNSDGTTTLTWEFIYNNKISKNQPEIEFQVLFDPSIFSGNNSIARATMTSTISGQSVSNPDIKDADSIQERTSTASYEIMRVTSMGIDLLASEQFIEMGNNDPAANGKTDADGLPVRLDDIHYNMRAVNWTSNTVRNARLLSILPYTNDGRGSSFNGTYQLQNVKFSSENSGAGKIYYTTSSRFNPGTDPNTIDLNQDGWTLYNNDSKVTIENVRAIMIVSERFDSNKILSVDFNVVPIGGVLRDTFSNTAIFNTQTTSNSKINTLATKTVREKRTLNGTVWLDNNMDGKISFGEENVSNIPVKLYRKSLDFNETSFKLVEKDLLGNDLTHLKTANNNGYYEFENLPEGIYQVEFQVGTKYNATIQDTDTTKNNSKTSKIGPVLASGAARSRDYQVPQLSAFPNSIFTVDSVHAGLIPTGTIEVYKYMSGLLTDANGDFKPDDSTEIRPDGSLVNQAAMLPDAVFELREVVTNVETEEIENTYTLRKETTDINGKLSINASVPFNEKDSSGNIIKRHTLELVEIKPPAGYEPLNQEISVVPQPGSTIRFYVPNKAQTKLPYTGSNHIVQSILIVAGFLFLIALGFVGVQLFRLDDGWQGR